MTSVYLIFAEGLSNWQLRSSEGGDSRNSAFLSSHFKSFSKWKLIHHLIHPFPRFLVLNHRKPLFLPLSLFLGYSVFLPPPSKDQFVRNISWGILYKSQPEDSIKKLSTFSFFNPTSLSYDFHRHLGYMT